MILNNTKQNYHQNVAVIPVLVSGKSFNKNEFNAPIVKGPDVGNKALVKASRKPRGKLTPKPKGFLEVLKALLSEVHIHITIEKRK